MEDIKFYNIINNELRSSPTTERVIDPRTEEPLWPWPVASTQDFEDAVAAARRAFDAGWGRTTVAERQEKLRQMAGVLGQHFDELAQILMRESGKSRLLANIDVGSSIEQCMHFSKPENALQDEVQSDDDRGRVVATHVPLGVVAAICPWNFPLILANIKVVSALVTGNCVIVKPSPFTPYAVTKWIELSREIFPPGVLQVVNGGADVGAAMTEHPGIDKISFTGTIATGKRVMAACAKTLKKVTLELAGNDACIVCEDANLDTAVPSVAGGAFFNAGQVCVASKRIYVHEKIYDEFVKRLAREVQDRYAIVDDPTIPSVFGPLDNKPQYESVKRIIEDCKAKGYDVITGGQTEAVRPRGFWLPPTIVAKPPEDSELVKEEQFGPVLPVLVWSDEDDVIRRANLANAGLGASVYSADLANAERIARRLDAGGVWINQAERPNYAAYFGGMKNSGFGGEMGKQGLLSYSYTKCLHFPKGEGK
ncbi:hypothetical protein VTJ04DRAFT_8681 [Mycothermus thermophilus]|uniref:uncharacterized protein n=1 Tax=Humicola insolens TaxID=85995 RepID=UPI003742B02D